jgi:hypothetical protein
MCSIFRAKANQNLKISAFSGHADTVDADIVCHDNLQRHDPESTVQALLHPAALPACLKYAMQAWR